MSEWRTVSLSDVALLRRGYDLPFARRRNGAYPVVGSAGISGWHDEGPVAGPGVTIGRSGASIGFATYVPGRYWPLNTTLFVEDFRGNDPRFVYYVLRNLDFQRFNSGSAQPSLNRNFIAGLRVSLPGRKEQSKIAQTLGGLDDKIAINGRTAATYEELLRAQFAELGLDREDPSEQMVMISDIITINPATAAPRGDNAVYLDMSALPTKTARVQEWSRRSPKAGTRFQNGDTVMARITPCLENGKTAFIDFMQDGETGIGSTEFIILRAREGIPVLLPYFLARSPRFRDFAIQNMVGSSGRQRVAASYLAQFRVGLPGYSRLAAFGELAHDAFAYVKSLDAESRSLRELRDTLLPKLMSGEIRVREAEKIVEDAT